MNMISGNGLQEDVSRQNINIVPINVGFILFSRISSVPGSPTLSFLQPLINSQLCCGSWVLIGSQIFLLLAKYIFRLENLPVLDVPKGQVLQIPIAELQSLLQYLGSRHMNPVEGSRTLSTITSMGSTPGVTFPTELPPQSPIYISLYISTDYSKEEFTPSMIAFVPVLSFPGLRGALPFLVLALLAVIFVRCVVPPETTGAKPEPSTSNSPKQFLNLSSEDILLILRRFGKYFGNR